jgi:hypothetical protein
MRWTGCARLLFRPLRMGATLLGQHGVGVFRKRLAREARRYLNRSRSDLPFLRSGRYRIRSLGMATPEEQAYLRWYAECEYTGRGEIVDLGCWLGASTIALATGLSQNPRVARKDRRIHAYDRFEWEPWMQEFLPRRLRGVCRLGASLLQEFHARTAPHASLVCTHAGDLAEASAHGTAPVEFLFNDVSKSWSLTTRVMQLFYPRLVPGLSLVVEQDFAHYYTAWVHLLRYRVRQYFEPVVHIPYSGSMVFRCTGAVPPTFLTPEYDFDSFSDAEKEQAFDYSLSLVSPEMSANVRAAKVMCYVHAGDLARARGLLEAYRRDGLIELDLLTLERAREAHDRATPRQP